MINYSFILSKSSKRHRHLLTYLSTILLRQKSNLVISFSIDWNMILRYTQIVDGRIDYHAPVGHANTNNRHITYTSYINRENLDSLYL